MFIVDIFINRALLNKGASPYYDAPLLYYRILGCMSSLQNYLLAIVPSTTMATLALTVPHVYVTFTGTMMVKSLVLPILFL